MASGAPDFAKLVPGFDFLQGLVRNAGAVLPNIGSWVAPTLDPQELEKRISELRTVQFWLEQNARMLATTIQALEVQRMTLSTLQTMNVQVADLQESMRIRLPQEEEEAAAAPAAPAAARTGVSSSWPLPPPVEPPAEAAPRKQPARSKKAHAEAGSHTAPAGGVDPMQWWGALTQQFTQLAAHAMRDVANDAARLAPGAAAPGADGAAPDTPAGGPKARAPAPSPRGRADTAEAAPSDGERGRPAAARKRAAGRRAAPTARGR